MRHRRALRIRPLEEASNEFLQVLLDSFRMRRTGSGCELDLCFDDRTDAIWLREAKKMLRQRISSEEIVACQKRIDDVLVRGTRKTYQHRGGAIRFRWGSGGTLPVIRRGGRDFYCLFYRDEHPVGWNLANGGASNLHELLHPEHVIERELREELLIVHPPDKQIYTFRWSQGRSLEHPDFAIARRIWDSLFDGEGSFSALEQVPLPLTWLFGPDTLNVSYGRERHTLRNCYVSVNAEDFGIEVDRIARLSVAPETIFCDGELTRGKLQNRTVGLFEVGRFNEAIASGSHEFHPDAMFFGGRERTGERAEDVTSEGMRYARINRLGDGIAWKAAIREGLHLDLCPVTRSLTERARALWEQGRDSGNACDVFLSFGSEDRSLARTVHDSLAADGAQVFFSDESKRTNFQRAINDALTQARAFVAVGTDLIHLTKPWVLYECDAFNGMVLSGTKPHDSPMVTLTSVDPHRLPLPLCARATIRMADPAHPESDIDRLRSYLVVPRPRTRAPARRAEPARGT